MTCFSPLQGFQSADLTSKGKRKTVFNRLYARADGMFLRTVPCNRCSGCRLTYSREWAVRCMHEASLFGDVNSFITLTYNDHFLPRIYSEDGRILGNGSLNYQHWTNFMKRLRKALSPRKIRFYMGPEYGDLSLRPHYHALIFNYDFPDKHLYTTRNGNRLYRSDFLESVWTDPDTGLSMGFSTVGSVTFESAAYVARYMMKKVKGEDTENRYTRYNLETGEIFFVEPEKARMSNRSGIGRDWFDKFAVTDIYTKDCVSMNGRLVRPPKYYDSLFENLSPEDFEAIKLSRQKAMAEMAHELTPERLRAREVCHLSSMQKLPRNIYQSKEF